MKKLQLQKSVSDEQKNAIKIFWDAFEGNINEIEGIFSSTKDNVFDLPQFMRAFLDPINNNLMWEVGPGLHKKYTLVVTPETSLEYMPVVKCMLGLAPKVANWEFHEYRLPLDQEYTVSIPYSAQKTTLENSSYSFSEGACGMIDIIVCIPLEDEENTRNDIVINIRLLLGDELFEKWVGFIEIGKKAQGNSSRPSKKSNNRTLKSDFEEKIQGLKKLHPNYYCRREGEDKHVLFELEPTYSEDYPEKSDLFSCVTPAPDLLSATLESKIPFYSERFTKNGETAFYLKIDDTENGQGSERLDRHQLEDVLDEALLGGKLGCVIGGGCGIKYSYIDVIGCDLDTAIPMIQKILTDRKLTKRSWFLFHDADLKKEWLGVYKDTPTPCL